MVSSISDLELSTLDISNDLMSSLSLVICTMFLLSSLSKGVTESRFLLSNS